MKKSRIDRSNIWQLNTPQIFPKDVLLHAFEMAEMNGITFTDESSMVKTVYDDVHMFQGEKTNIKITVKEDLVLAKAIMEYYEN